MEDSLEQIGFPKEVVDYILYLRYMLMYREAFCYFIKYDMIPSCYSRYGNQGPRTKDRVINTWEIGTKKHCIECIKLKKYCGICDLDYNTITKECQVEYYFKKKFQRIRLNLLGDVKKTASLT
jgi:hypothetical protein